MSTAFSVASWNVKHFGAKDENHEHPEKSIGQVIDYLKSQDADVVGIYEVESKMVFKEIVQRMPDYQFYITEGKQTQEILVGVKSDISSFLTQKTEFKTKDPYLRPGALLTLYIDGEYYPLLFLHLKSLDDPIDFGRRDVMTQKAIDFYQKLNERYPDDNINYIFMGDLNTMGMDITYLDKDVTGNQEIERLKERVQSDKANIRLLDKTGDATYWPGSDSDYPPSNLDHVVAANHLEFKDFGGASVDLRGWVNEESDEAKDEWTRTYSDHALLYFEVQKV